MKIELSWVVGICLGNLVSCIFNSESQGIQLFNTIGLLLVVVYLIQQESDKNKPETKDSDV
jgi:F0F1-type ATP synthase assembly protein I